MEYSEKVKINQEKELGGEDHMGYGEYTAGVGYTISG